MIKGIEINQPKRINRIASGECLLSISLLVSNNIQTIEKCMESIRPLLEQIPSELIIVDTVGEKNSDGSLAIAREYADKIVHFEWCDDFAAARNAGLKECQGQWFMFFDDDEYFDDVSELIHFFQDEQLLATHDIIEIGGRDYVDRRGMNYKTRRSFRIYRSYPGIKFVGQIHERLNNIGGSIYSASSYVHHYGYIYNSQKKDRNEKILFDLVENNPQEYSSWLQLVIAYSSKDALKQIEILEKAIQTYDETTFQSLLMIDQKAFLELIVKLNESYCRISRVDKSMELVEQYVSLFKHTKFNQALYTYMKLNNYLYMRDYNNVFRYYQKFQEYVYYFDNNKQQYYQEYTPFYKVIIEFSYLEKFIQLIINLLDDTIHECELLVFYRIINWDKLNVPSTKFIYLLIKHGFQKNDMQLLRSLYQLCLEKEREKDFILAVQKMKDSLRPSELIEFRRYVVHSHIKTPYANLQRYLIEKNSTKRKTLFYELKDSIKEYTFGLEEYVYELLKNDISPEYLLQKVKMSDLDRLCDELSKCCMGNMDEEIQLIEKIDQLFEIEWLKNYMLYQLLKSIAFRPSLLTSEILEALNLYLYYGKKIKQILYPNMNISAFTSSEFELLDIFEKILDAKEKQNFKEYSHYIKQGLKLAPSLNDVFDKLIYIGQEEIAEQTAIVDELDELASQVKANIFSLIMEGKLSEANQVYQELIQIVPETKDLLQIKQLIEKGR